MIGSVDLFAPVNQTLEMIERSMLTCPQVEAPLKHHFAPNVYLREISMPAGSLIIGHEHKTEHFNVVLTGRATVWMNGETKEIAAPCIFVSEPGVRKVLYIHEEMRWATVHPTKTTEIAKLEDELIIKSEAYLDDEQMRACINQAQAIKQEDKT